MDVETITKLLDAGYTKAEIDAMAGKPESGDPEPDAGANDPDAGKEQSNAGAENAGAVIAPEISEVVKNLTESVKGLQETVKAMQDKNAAGASTDKPEKDTIYDTIKSFTEKL